MRQYLLSHTKTLIAFNLVSAVVFIFSAWYISYYHIFTKPQQATTVYSYIPDALAQNISSPKNQRFELILASNCHIGDDEKYYLNVDYIPLKITNATFIKSLCSADNHSVDAIVSTDHVYDVRILDEVAPDNFISGEHREQYFDLGTINNVHFFIAPDSYQGPLHPLVVYAQRQIRIPSEQQITIRTKLNIIDGGNPLLTGFDSRTHAVFDSNNPEPFYQLIKDNFFPKIEDLSPETKPNMQKLVDNLSVFSPIE